MRLSLSELATHKVFAQFSAGDDVTITVYNRTTESEEVLTNDECTEFGSGIFEWSFADLDSQPGSLAQFVWVMDNTSTTQTGTVEAGGYPDRVEELLANPTGVVAVETPWVVGNLPAGGDVTLRLFNSTGVEQVLTTNVCTEFISGYYRWSTSNMSVYPSSVGSYMWIMNDSVSGRTTWGITPIGTPEDLGEVAADGIWDALTADHTVAGSYGVRVDTIPTAAENRQEMDSNSTQLADIVEDTGTDIPATLSTIEGKIDSLSEGPSAPTAKAIREEIDANSAKLKGIDRDTKEILGKLSGPTQSKWKVK